MEQDKKMDRSLFWSGAIGQLTAPAAGALVAWILKERYHLDMPDAVAMTAGALLLGALAWGVSVMQTLLAHWIPNDPPRIVSASPADRLAEMERRYAALKPGEERAELGADISALRDKLFGSADAPPAKGGDHA